MTTRSSEVDIGEREDHSSPLVAVFITALLTAFMAAAYGFGMYLFSQLVTDMRADIGFGYATVGVITAGGQLGFLVFALLGAWLAARVGGGQVIVGSGALCGICLVGLPMTDSIIVIGVLLAILGGTAASVYVPMVEIVARVITYRHRGKVLGLVSSGTSYGVVVNSLLVPYFVLNDNWRGVWYVVGFGTLAVTVIGVIAFWRLGLFRPSGGSREKAEGTSGSERSSGDRGVPLRRLLVPWVVVIWIITFLNGFSTMPFQNYLSPYLREGLGFSVDYAALVWGLIGFIGMFAGFAIGWLSDKTGVRLAMLFCYFSILLSAALLVVAPVGPIPVISGVLFSLAFYPVFGLVPAYVAKTVDGTSATTIFGIANVTLGVGGMAGNYAGGMLESLTGSFVWIYVMIGLTAILLALLASRLPSESTEEGPAVRGGSEDSPAEGGASEVSVVGTSAPKTEVPNDGPRGREE